MPNKTGNIFTGLIEKPESTHDGDKREIDIVQYDIVDIIVRTGDGDEDFIVKKRKKEVSRVDRSDYISSFSDEVGIQNILKKVQLTGDHSLLDQRVPVDLPIVETIEGKQLQEIYDSTNIPDDITKAYALIEKGVNAFDNLPDEIKQKMDMETFVKNFGQDKLDSYLNSKKTVEETVIKEGE